MKKKKGSEKDKDNYVWEEFVQKNNIKKKFQVPASIPMKEI